jgi:tetratricopeptide (TPR) repeat protein
VYHRLTAKADLAEKLYIAFLKEDEWGITSFLDLLLHILRTVLEEENLTAPDNIRDLSRLTEEQAETRVANCLLELLGSRTLFVIIENLDAVFRKLGEQGQRQWRALMQTHPQWTILATTPALFTGISHQFAPFYGFFEVIHLQPLSFDDAVTLLKRLAAWNKDEGITAFLDTAAGRARVRAVQHLAGGNHRIFVLFYDFLSQTGSEHFAIPLLKTIDALTPYYQSQMDKLSPQQQKIVNFLCEHRKPATVTTIAENCFTTHQTAASQLKQLLANRYVRVDRIGREAFYELTEPLLRICVEAKTHHEHPLHLLVDFVRFWFSREELEQKLSQVGDRDPGRPYLVAALKEYDSHGAHEHLDPEIARLCRALSVAKDTPIRLRRQAYELAELSKIAEDWPHYARATVWLNRAAEAVPLIEKAVAKDPTNVDLLQALAHVCTSAGLIGQAEGLFDKAITLDPQRSTLFFDKGIMLAAVEENQEALDMFEQASRLDPDLRISAALEKARVLLKMEDFKAVRETLDPFLNQGERFNGIFLRYGISFARENKLSEAIEYFDKAAQSFENDAFARGNKGIALCELERYKEAIPVLDLALELIPTQERYLHYRCEALLKTHQYDIAANTVPLGILSHCLFHRFLDFLNSRPQQGKLQQDLMALRRFHSSDIWRNAFIGGLTEFASLAAKFNLPPNIETLQIWNAALHKLFVSEPEFSILLKLFDVLTRVKALNDRKALLELPREQRLLLITPKEEEDFGEETSKSVQTNG